MAVRVRKYKRVLHFVNSLENYSFVGASYTKGNATVKVQGVNYAVGQKVVFGEDKETGKTTETVDYTDDYYTVTGVIKNYRTNEQGHDFSLPYRDYETLAMITHLSNLEEQGLGTFDLVKDSVLYNPQLQEEITPVVEEDKTDISNYTAIERWNFQFTTANEIVRETLVLGNIHLVRVQLTDDLGGVLTVLYVEGGVKNTNLFLQLVMKNTKIVPSAFNVLIHLIQDQLVRSPQSIEISYAGMSKRGESNKLTPEIKETSKDVDRDAIRNFFYSKSASDFIGIKSDDETAERGIGKAPTNTTLWHFLFETNSVSIMESSIRDARFMLRDETQGIALVLRLSMHIQVVINF